MTSNPNNMTKWQFNFDAYKGRTWELFTKVWAKGG